LLFDNRIFPNKAILPRGIARAVGRQSDFTERTQFQPRAEAVKKVFLQNEPKNSLKILEAADRLSLRRPHSTAITT
jgi:hypothetical protein